MVDDWLDLLGQAFLWLIPTTPFIATFFIWKKAKGLRGWEKVVIGLILALIVSLILWFLALKILLRDGLGPT